MLVFKTLKIQGFGSIIKTLEYILDTPGLTAIMGENGAGKTSIISALSWVLFGQTLKKKNIPEPWEDIKPKKFKGTRVSITFEYKGLNYKIYRHYKYKGKTLKSKGGSRLILVAAGVQATIRDKKDVQKEINELLGFSFELFKNSIIFGQKMKRIIEEKGPARNKIFEEVFEVMFISKAKKKAEEKRKRVIEDLLKIQPDLVKYKTLLENNKELKVEYKDQLKKFEANKTKEIRKIKKEILITGLEIGANEDLLNESDKWEEKKAEYKQTIEDLDAKILKLKPITDDHFKLDFKVEMTKGEIKDQETEIQKVKDQFKQPNLTCSKCGGGISKQTLKANHSGLKGALAGMVLRLKIEEKKLKKLTKKKSSLPEDHDLLTRTKHELEKLQGKINDKASSKATVKILKKNLSKLHDQLKAKEDWILDLDLVEVKKRIKKFRKKLKPLKLQHKKFTKKIDLMNWLIKDPLSNFGLKAYIFESMLKLVNRELLQYSKVLGWKIKFNIDLQSARKNFITTVYQGKKERPYEDLSGGQQQLVNACIAFAIHDVVNLERDCNILIMDEPFESLSKKYIHIISDLMMEKSKYKSVHLITHLAEFNPVNCHLIQVELSDKGRTKLVA